MTEKIIKVPDGKICDYIDSKFRNNTPEEYVRQTRINDLAPAANGKRYEAFLMEQEAIDMMNWQVIFA